MLKFEFIYLPAGNHEDDELAAIHWKVQKHEKLCWANNGGMLVDCRSSIVLMNKLIIICCVINTNVETYLYGKWVY